MRLFHYTGVKFSVGDILSAQPDGYCHWPENDAMESVLESRRPDHCIPRKESVFLTSESCNGERYGADSADYELTVTTSSSFIDQRSDLQWLAPIDMGFSSEDELFSALDETELYRLIDGYWSGKPYNNEPKFEYRTREAIIISITKQNRQSLIE